MIKPEFFDDPDIGLLSAEAALFFIGLLTQADKEGRLSDEPRRLKVRIRPYSKCDANNVLRELSDAGFIIRYTSSTGQSLIQIRSFHKHQRPHPKEAESTFEGPTSQECSAKTQSREKVVLSREKDMASKPDPNSGSLILDPTSGEGEGRAAIAVTPDGLADAWNRIIKPPIAHCRDITHSRRTHARARIAERPLLADWVEVIERIQASPFCNGRNDRGWVATFDWLLKPETAVRVLEGKYDDRPAVIQRRGKETLSEQAIRSHTEFMATLPTDRPERPSALPARPTRQIASGE